MKMRGSPLAFGASLGTVMQVSFVVDDIEREMEHWTRTLRVGPFFYLPHFPILDAEFHGSPITIDVDIALAFSGTTCFELIRQNDETPSPFRASSTRVAGLHHWGVSTRTFEADLEQSGKSGMTCIASGRVALGGRCAYLETGTRLGALVELIEITPSVEQFFAMIQAAAQGWDGSDPVRRMGP
jgi:hypothetical protein